MQNMNIYLPKSKVKGKLVKKVLLSAQSRPSFPHSDHRKPPQPHPAVAASANTLMDLHSQHHNSPIRPPPPPPHMQQKRKKWTEEEERTLIDKYSSMTTDGTMSRLRTREKKFRPIAAHVNSLHYSLDPVTFPFQWSWKDACTKVQNMRHQYLLVKQKIQNNSPDENLGFRWDEGESYWPNFLLYKQVFGDHPLPSKPSEFLDEDGELGLGIFPEEDDKFDYNYVSVPTDPPLPLLKPAVQVRKRKRKRKAERKVWAFLVAEVDKMKERELKVDEREKMEEDWRESERRRRRDEEREWEERMEDRRMEWRKKMEGMMTQHRLDMEQMQARIVHEQQSVVNHLFGFIAQLGGNGNLRDGSGGGVAIGSQNHHHQAYASQMIHSFQNGTEENRVDGDSQDDDQFIVD